MGKAKALHEGLSQVVVTSIGPLTSEELRGRGLAVDIECAHPKMGFLVQEAAEKAPELLNRKRSQLSS
jgi:uroporphyrinogen-III synthase